MDLEDNLAARLEYINKNFKLMPHTHPGQLSSTIRRMRAEMGLNIPIKYRTGFAMSVETGKSASEMNEEEWEKFYKVLCEELKTKYPSLYNNIFKEK